MSVSACKDCHAPIDFIQLDNGRWKPVRPGTREFHRCQLEQKCADCLKVFMGAPWMTQCPDCFKNSRPGREGFRKPHDTGAGIGSGSSPSRHTKMERVRMPAGHDDDNFGEEPGQKKNDDYYDDIPF